MLVKGVACLSTQSENGGRQIHAFYYSGDFLGLHHFLFPGSPDACEVQALTICSIRTIDRDAVEHEIQRQPGVGRVLWQAAIKEASIWRQHLIVRRRPALQRVAHLLCEQLARLESDEGVVPLSQVDVADAAGLSAVHTNRVLQELRELGMLSKQRLIEVVTREALEELAGFDARYLDPDDMLFRWDVHIDE